MTTTDAQRLARLRATDTIGLFASNGDASGTDSTGTVRVTVDPTNRLVGVHIGRLDETHRSPGALAQLVDQAYTAALLSKLPDLPVAEAAPATRPRAHTLTPTRVVLTNFAAEGREPAPAPAEVPAVDAAPAVGHSNNGCVTTTLPAAQSKGVLTIDAGWLRNAGEANIAAAITEAYTAAYQQRDRA